MKKILSLIAMFLIATVIVGCTVVDDSLEIVKTPATTYNVGYDGEVEFELKLDGVEHVVTWSKGKYQVKVGAVPEVDVTSIPEFSITPLDFATPGTKTVTFRYKALSASFEYQVVAEELPTGTGTQNDPYLVYAASDLTKESAKAVMTDSSRTNTVYFKLVNDIDFAGQTLYIDVFNISIDGAKQLGGNYKISNIQKTSLFKDGKNVTLKNIDIVNASADLTIVGVIFSNFTFDNLNILGDSAASSAAYIHTANTKDTDISVIKNSTTRANLVRFDAGSSTGAFVRYVAAGSLEIDNSFNHGHIQALNSMSSGLVGAANTGSVTIKNSGNMGKVTLYIGSEEDYNMMVANLANTQYAGIYTLIGHNKGANNMNSFYGTAKTRVTLTNNQFNATDVKLVKVNEFTFGATIDFSTAGFLTGFTKADLAKTVVTVTNSTAQTHVLNDGVLTKGTSSGNVVVFEEEVTGSDNLSLITEEQVKTIVANPFTSSINAAQTLNGVEVKPANSLGYDIFADGLYRVATTNSVNHLISVIGRNAAGEVIFVSVAMAKF